MPEGGISHRGAQMSRQGKRVTTIGINYWINQLSEKLFKNTDIFMFICLCVYWYSVILFYFFNFAPLFYAAASHLLCARVRARRLSGHMAATLIDHACRFLSCVRVRSCPCCLLLLLSLLSLLLLLLLFIILRNSWPVVSLLWAQQRQQQQRRIALIITTTVCNTKMRFV